MVERSSSPGPGAGKGRKAGQLLGFVHVYIYIYIFTELTRWKLYTLNTFSLWATPLLLDTNLRDPTCLTPVAQRRPMQSTPQTLVHSLSCSGEARISTKSWEGKAAHTHSPRQAPASGLTQRGGRGPTTHHLPSMPTCYWHGLGVAVPTESKAGWQRSWRSGLGVEGGGC